MIIDWLINYIPQPIGKGVSDFKDKIVSLFKTNTPKQTVYGRGKRLRNKTLRSFLYQKRIKEKLKIE